MTSKHVRCAVYTRKSSEEGLEQSFNSLEAQREACRAFILSQKHEGWTALNNRYDDGGFSGGTMERPALKRLLDDILAGKLDTVVVYKVDRLTRSLTDFAKIIERVRLARGQLRVRHPAVQHDNLDGTAHAKRLAVVCAVRARSDRRANSRQTGRFEEEGHVDGRRRPPGLRLRGPSAHGQSARSRNGAHDLPAVSTPRLREEAQRLLGPQRDPEQAAHEQGTDAPAGATSCSRGALYHLLNNRVYVGEIVHRGESYPGQHEAIVPRELWDQVAARLQTNNQAHRSTKSQSTPSLLSGMIFDPKGCPFHADARRQERETVSLLHVAGCHPGDWRQARKFLASQPRSLKGWSPHKSSNCSQSPDKCTAGLEGSPEKEVAADRALELAKRWPKLEISTQHEFVRKVVRRVVVGQSAVWIEFNPTRLAEALLGRKLGSNVVAGEPERDIIKVAADFKPLRRGSELCLMATEELLFRRNSKCLSGKGRRVCSGLV